MISREDLLRNARDLPSPPIAVEAYWDGDTHGWFVVLSALLDDNDGGFVEHTIAALSGGGDLRLFNNQVPPWPEAQLADAVGREISASFGVPFWFPSPTHPEDECPRFWERENAVPSAGCGIPLLQKESCPWRGICSYCHLEKERRPLGD
jgi:hypothetical protein